MICKYLCKTLLSLWQSSEFHCGKFFFFALTLNMKNTLVGIDKQRSILHNNLLENTQHFLSRYWPIEDKMTSACRKEMWQNGERSCKSSKVIKYNRVDSKYTMNLSAQHFSFANNSYFQQRRKLHCRQKNTQYNRLHRNMACLSWAVFLIIP